MVLTQIINWVYTDILTVIYHQISIFGNNTKYRLTVFSVVDMGSIWIAEHLAPLVCFPSPAAYMLWSFSLSSLILRYILQIPEK
jgi:hypothetical protein